MMLIFQQLFNDYTSQGIVSIPEAMLVGQTMEENDISTLENYLTFVDEPNIIKVYTSLNAASLKHLTSLSGHSILTYR